MLLQQTPLQPWPAMQSWLLAVSNHVHVNNAGVIVNVQPSVSVSVSAKRIEVMREHW